MLPKLTRTPVLLAAILLAAACGSPGGTSSSGSTPTPTNQKVASVDACTLVTASEASAAVGTPVINLMAEGGGVQIPGACIYGASGSSSSVFVYAQVYPDTTTADAVQPDQIAAILAGQLGVTNAHSVNGIGDKAFEYSATGSAGGGIAIFVFKANVVMMIAVDPTTSSSAIEQLARTALGRLVFS